MLPFKQTNGPTEKKEKKTDQKMKRAKNWKTKKKKEKGKKEPVTYLENKWLAVHLTMCYNMYICQVHGQNVKRTDQYIMVSGEGYVCPISSSSPCPRLIASCTEDTRSSSHI